MCNKWITYHCIVVNASFQCCEAAFSCACDWSYFYGHKRITCTWRPIRSFAWKCIWLAGTICIHFGFNFHIDYCYFYILNKSTTGSCIISKKANCSFERKKIVSAQLTSFLFLTGHLTLYAYLTPFLKDIMHVEAKWISLFYFIFGIAAVIGGGFGGWLADKWGSKKSIISIIIVFACAMFLLPIMTFSFPLFIVMMAIWSMLSWAISPVQQNYLIEIAPESAGILLFIMLG